MKGFTTKLAAAIALVALGGAAGFALNADHGGAATEAQKQPPVVVRTQVIRRTVRIHRKPHTPKRQPSVAGTSAPSPRVMAAPTPAQPVVAARPAAPAVTRAPIRTRTSGAGGQGGHEHESEGHDD